MRLLLHKEGCSRLSAHAQSTMYMYLVQMKHTCTVDGREWQHHQQTTKSEKIKEEKQKANQSTGCLRSPTLTALGESCRLALSLASNVPADWLRTKSLSG